MSILVPPRFSKSDVGVFRSEISDTHLLKIYHGSCSTLIEANAGGTAKCSSCWREYFRAWSPVFDLLGSTSIPHIQAWVSCWLEIPIKEIGVSIE